MAREFAKTNLSIHQDDDWRALPAPAQHLYGLLSTHPELSYCGVADWRPGRLVSFASGWDVDDIRVIADCLESRFFIVRDEVTEEVLVRSWIRFDGLIKQPRLAVSMANAFAAVSSNEIRGVIVHELNKLRKLEPDAPGWAKKQVADILGLRSVDPKSRDVPGDPFGQGFAYGFAHRFRERLAQTQPNVSVPVSIPPTTATATATLQQQHAKSSQQPDSIAEDFTTWWAEYPMKKDKGHALKAYRAARKKATARVLLDALTAWAPIAKQNPKYIPLAATWLNGERWEDEISPAGNEQPKVTKDWEFPEEPPDEVLSDPEAYGAWIRDRSRRSA